MGVQDWVFGEARGDAFKLLKRLSLENILPLNQYFLNNIFDSRY